jgi:hypothetical protein
MSIKLLNVLKKEITEQGGKFKGMTLPSGEKSGDVIGGLEFDASGKFVDYISPKDVGKKIDDSPNYDGQPQIVDPSIYKSINFKNIGLGNPLSDKINPSLLMDIDSAAQIAGTMASVTTAVSGHDTGTRHESGLAVDLAMFDGLGYGSKEDAKNKKIYDKIEKFVNALEDMGYIINRESGNDKAVLWFGFAGHNNHVHVSRKSYNTPTKDAIPPEPTKDSDKNSMSVVIGGMGYATPDWMKTQWIAAGLPTNNVKFISYDSTELTSLKKKNNVKKIMGFSAGGSDVWEEIDTNPSQYSFIGLMDPSTSKLRKSVPSNVFSLSNHKNWDSILYPNIRSNLKKMEEMGVLTKTNTSHKEIPLEFFKKYKSKLM